MPGRDGPSVLIAIERLLLRVRQAPSRATELITLRARTRAEQRAKPNDQERAVAHEMRVLKQQISTALADVTSCATCAKGKHAPRGTFPGGDCCSGVTADLFSDDELGALVAAGTRPGDLVAPRTTHAGCAFRGSTGCTLSAANRPQRCVHYTCVTLRRELRADGKLAAVDVLLATLKDCMARYVAAREQRQDDELFRI